MIAADAARQILNRLHDVMASRMHAQGKLDQVVEIIGTSLNSEVCSVRILTSSIGQKQVRTNFIPLLACRLSIASAQ